MSDTTTQPTADPGRVAPSSTAQDVASASLAAGASDAPPSGGARQAPILPTHVPNLDTLLGGGIQKGSLAFISGPPGSGKTTLAAQIAFAAARNGQRVVVLTALSEPTDKLIAHMRSFTFFDQSLIGDAIQVISLQSFLAEGLEVPEDEIVRLTRQTRASFVIIDGFRGIAAVDTTRGVRQFLYSVGAKLNILGATTLITSEANVHDAAYFPEATIADVIIGLTYMLDGVRTRRGVEIVKSRGTAPLEGLHALQFSPDGLIMFPRLEVSAIERQSRHAASLASDSVEELHEMDEMERERRALSAPRATFALPALDDVLGGGLTRGTSTLVLGSPGTGKTLLALSFAAAGARAGEPAVFVSFRESRAQLFEKAEPFNLAKVLRGGDTRGESADAPINGVTVLRWAPVELDPDVVAFRILAAVDAVGARRLVIDGLSELEYAIADQGDPRRVRSYTAALLEALSVRYVTSLFIKETDALGEIGGLRVDVASDASAVLAANMLLLRQVVYRGAVRRVLGVLKMRFSAFDASLREFTISPPAGIIPLSPLQSDADGIEVEAADVSGRHTPRAHGGMVGADVRNAMEGS